jgi:hypothetical protein
MIARSSAVEVAAKIGKSDPDISLTRSQRPIIAGLLRIVDIQFPQANGIGTSADIYFTA